MKKVIPFAIAVFVAAALLFTMCHIGGGTKDPDEDGVLGKDDKCPDVAGSVCSAGCPDTLGKAHVYLDDSKSNQGYLTLNSEYQGLVSELIDGIGKDADFSFIHDEIKPFEGDATALKKYITGGGKYDASCSEMHTMIEKILAKNGKNDISILITDGILSSCKGTSKNYQDLLAAVRGSLKDKGIATRIARFESNFDGTYFVESIDDRVGKPTKAKRPYYVLVFSKKCVMPLFNEQVLAKVTRFQPTHDALFGINEEGGQAIGKCAIIAEGNKKEWRAKGNKISDIKTEGKITVPIAVDFNMLPTNYLGKNNLDTLRNLLKISNAICVIKSITLAEDEKKNYTKDITKTILDKESTHLIVLELTGLLSSEEVHITLETPDWYEAVSTDNDATPEDGKTYYLKHFIGGISEAYLKDGKAPAKTNKLVDIPILFEK